jgi:MinD-like ATPase involved in chromosome partitioning or flagellar assembly
MSEALRRVVADQIGPRRPGVVYSDGVTNLRVLDLIADPSEARRILKRRAAQFAVIVQDLHTGIERATCAVWTGSDRVLKAVAA